VFLKNRKANDVNGFIDINMNLKGLYKNRLDWLFLENEKANDVNGFINISMNMKGLYGNGLISCS
jgi:hypothetical protein